MELPPEYTEKAMALVGETLPPLIYLPPSLRTRPAARIARSGSLTEQQLDRVVEADPLGFLIGVMQGQSIVSISVQSSATDEGAERSLPSKRGRPKKQTSTARILVAEENGHSIFAEYHTPSVADRERVAMYLADRLLDRRRSALADRPIEKDDYDLLVARRAAQASQAPR